MSEEKEPRHYRLKIETAHFGQTPVVGSAMKILVFTFDQWDDGEGQGWDAYRGSKEVISIEEARLFVEAINDGHTKTSGFSYYQIVDRDQLKLIDQGAIDFEWAADGNTAVKSKCREIR